MFNLGLNTVYTYDISNISDEVLMEVGEKVI